MAFVKISTGIFFFKYIHPGLAVTLRFYPNKNKDLVQLSPFHSAHCSIKLIYII